jgi:hypothetical protein
MDPFARNIRAVGCSQPLSLPKARSRGPYPVGDTSLQGIAKGAMDDIPQETSGDLRNRTRARLLRVHSMHLERLGLTECHREAYDVYAEAMQRACWPLTESLLGESIPAWVFQWGVVRGWLPYPPMCLVPGRGNLLEGWAIRSAYRPVPAAELTVPFGPYKVTDWYKAGVLKRPASRIAYWQAKALLSNVKDSGFIEPLGGGSTRTD